MGDPAFKANIPTQSFIQEMLGYIGLSRMADNGAAPEGVKVGGAGNVTVTNTIPWGTRVETQPYLEGGKPASPELGQTIPAIFKTFTDFVGKISLHDKVAEHLKTHPAFEKMYKPETVALDPVGATLEQYDWEKTILDRLPEGIAGKPSKEMDAAIEQVVGEVANVKFWGDALREVEATVVRTYGEISGKLTLDFVELEKDINKSKAKEKGSFGKAASDGAAKLEAKEHEGIEVIPSDMVVTKAEGDHEKLDHDKIEAKIK